ncbi:hypothetical protein ACIBU0_25990 [Streptomyces sp. NPDC049627]|uniref:hypothetical protein n=1 Tax=Streptomyces sp. NPDC049627 TaxID=3365595 RepID=UPI003788FC0A
MAAAVGGAVDFGGQPAAGPSEGMVLGDGVVGAAVLLDRLGIQPRAVAFLAEVVQRGRPVRGRAAQAGAG